MKYQLTIYTAQHRHLNWEIPMPHKDIRIKIAFAVWAAILTFAAVSVIRPA